MGPLIGVVVPSCGHFDYVAATIDGLFYGNHERFAVFLVDDASFKLGAVNMVPSFLKHADRMRAGQFDVHQFKEHGGYIRSINEGASWACERQLEYLCLSNSDLLFAAGW